MAAPLVFYAVTTAQVVDVPTPPPDGGVVATGAVIEIGRGQYGIPRGETLISRKHLSVCRASLASASSSSSPPAFWVSGLGTNYAYKRCAATAAYTRLDKGVATPLCAGDSVFLIRDDAAAAQGAAAPPPSAAAAPSADSYRFEFVVLTPVQARARQRPGTAAAAAVPAAAAPAKPHSAVAPPPSAPAAVPAPAAVTASGSFHSSVSGTTGGGAADGKANPKTVAERAAAKAAAVAEANARAAERAAAAAALSRRNRTRTNTGLAPPTATAATGAGAVSPATTPVADDARASSRSVSRSPVMTAVPAPHSRSPTPPARDALAAAQPPAAAPAAAAAADTERAAIRAALDERRQRLRAAAAIGTTAAAPVSSAVSAAAPVPTPAPVDRYDRYREKEAEYERRRQQTSASSNSASAANGKATATMAAPAMDGVTSQSSSVVSAAAPARPVAPAASVGAKRRRPGDAAASEWAIANADDDDAVDGISAAAPPRAAQLRADAGAFSDDKKPPPSSAAARHAAPHSSPTKKPRTGGVGGGSAPARVADIVISDGDGDGDADVDIKPPKAAAAMPSARKKSEAAAAVLSSPTRKKPAASAAAAAKPKSRRALKAAAEAEAAESGGDGLFRGFGLFLHELGLSPKQRDLFRAKFRERGGVNISELPISRRQMDGSWNTLILIAAVSSERELLRRLRIDRFRTAWHVHTPEWLTDTLRRGALAPWTSHRLALVDPPKPVETDDERHAREQREADEARAKQAAAMTAEQVRAHNAQIVVQLEALSKVYHSTGDHWRTATFNRVAHLIRAHPHAILTGAQARQIKGVGERTADKIQEILATGKLSRLDVLMSDERNQVQLLFASVHGVGAKTAQVFYDQGFRTLDDLRTKAKLTDQQRKYLSFYDEFQQKIPRAEVSVMEELVSEQLKKVNPLLSMYICGSYRRGKASVGDVDILITYNDPTLRATAGEPLDPTLVRGLCRPSEMSKAVGAAAAERAAAAVQGHSSPMKPRAGDAKRSESLGMFKYRDDDLPPDGAGDDDIDLDAALFHGEANAAASGAAGGDDEYDTFGRDGELDGPHSDGPGSDAKANGSGAGGGGGGGGATGGPVKFYRKSRFADGASFGTGADARPGAEMRQVLEQLIGRLKRVGFLTDDFVMPHERAHYNKEKNLYEGHDNECYMGICRLPAAIASAKGLTATPVHRRIDIRIYHRTEIAFALLYFTGSKEFNRQMRLYSNKRKSLSLSDHALTAYRLAEGGYKKVKVRTGEKNIQCLTEEEIFLALDLPYFAPTERDGIPIELYEYDAAAADGAATATAAAAH